MLSHIRVRSTICSNIVPFPSKNWCPAASVRVQRSFESDPRSSSCSRGATKVRGLKEEENALPGEDSRRNVLFMGGMAAVGGMAAGSLIVPEKAEAGLESYNITGKKIQEVTISLGTAANSYVFEPSEIRLTAGRLTKLKMVNPSNLNHYFTALEFADKVYTVLVLAGEPEVEIKGKVQEVELDAGASLTWILVPIKPGTYPVTCTVKGHAEAGMVASIVVQDPDSSSSDSDDNGS